MTTTPNHTLIKNNIFAATVALLLVLSTGCAKSGQFPAASTGDSNQSSGVTTPGTDDGTDNNTDSGNTGTTPPPTTEPPTTPEPSYKMVPLAWESTKYPERASWSQHLQKIILEDWNSLLPGANDITNFCPRYNSLDNNERANVWAQLFVA
ncbi:MAG: hypothetical protein KUL82_06985, partial [Bdellovibrio sp.]|nr:hypothetical protein [Bdellovibrio sp.]